MPSPSPPPFLPSEGGRNDGSEALFGGGRGALLPPRGRGAHRLRPPARGKAWAWLPTSRRAPDRADSGQPQLTKQAARRLPPGSRSAEGGALSISVHACTAGNAMAGGAALGFDGCLSVVSDFSGEWTRPGGLPAASAWAGSPCAHAGTASVFAHFTSPRVFSFFSALQKELPTDVR